MESGDLIAVGIVWLIIIAIAINNILDSKKGTEFIFSKGVKIEDPSTHLFKYTLEPIFSSPSDGYELKYTSINLEIISGRIIRLARIPITCDSLVITRNILCFKDIRANFTLIRKRAIPSINRVRAIHNCQVIGSNIFLEGIELHDLNEGERRYYSIQEYVYNEETEEARIPYVKRPEISCFSKQTLTPNFIPLSIEDFGRPIKSIKKDGTIEEENGLIISPKLHWFEAIIFYSFFFMSTFFTTVAILVYLRPSLNETFALVTAILLSGFFGLYFTESLAVIYRDYIKRNYNAKCAPMRVSSGTSSKIWSFIRHFYLFLVFMCALLGSVSIPFMIDSKKNKTKTLAEDFDFKALEDQTFNEIFFLLVFLMASLLITLTIWFVVFAIIRYFCRKRKLPKVNVDLESGNSDTNQQQITLPVLETDSIKTEENATQGLELKRKKLNQYNDNKTDKSSRRKIDFKTSTTSTKSDKSDSLKKKKRDKSKHQNLELGTKYLEREMANKEKRNRLTTSSVIVGPTKSVGFINPEDFRLTQSTIDVQEKKNSDKTKKNK